MAAAGQTVDGHEAPLANGEDPDLINRDRDLIAGPAAMAVLYVWRTLGRAGARELAAAVGRDLIATVVNDSEAWITYGELRKVVQAASSICHEPDLGRLCGEELARTIGQLGLLTPLLGMSFAEALPAVLGGYNASTRLRDYRLEVVDETELVIFTGPRSSERDLFLCRFFCGFVCELGRTFEVIPTIVETECCARGDQQCRAVVHWSDAASAVNMTWTDHVEHLHDWTRTLTEAQDPVQLLAHVTDQFQAPPSLQGLLVAVRLDGAIYHHATGVLHDSTSLEVSRLLDDPRSLPVESNRVVHILIEASQCQGGRAFGVFAQTVSTMETQMITAYASHVAVAIDAAMLFSEWRDTARLDDLTGLVNRNALARAVGEMDAEARNTMLVGFLDLDDFKAVNDELGHSAGDELLCEVAQRLQHRLRPTDVVARLGGDEFVVVLGNVCDDAAVATVRAKLDDVFVTPFACGGNLVEVRASLGVAFGVEAEGSLDELLALADERMYFAKRSRATKRIHP